jgi:hypothetical protein
MTVTTYILRFTEKSTPERTIRYYAPISWDKHNPGILEAQLCPMVAEHEAGFPVWRATEPYSLKGLQLLIQKTKKKAKSLGLELESEKETDYPVKERDPQVSPPQNISPTSHHVIILKGDFAGQEGVCLGPVKDKDGLWAVSPDGSNKIMNLRFEEEFAILINRRQEPGKN